MCIAHNPSKKGCAYHRSLTEIHVLECIRIKHYACQFKVKILKIKINLRKINQEKCAVVDLITGRHKNEVP